MSNCCVVAFESVQTYRTSVDDIRRDALMRLYARKAAVDDLIRSLENYQKTVPTRKAECIPFSAGMKCS